MINKRRNVFIILITIDLLIAAGVIWWFFFRVPASAFDGERAYRDVVTQVSLGARHVGSPGHAALLDWMEAELQTAGWQTERRPAEMMGHPIINLVAHRSQAAPVLLLGAHFDTRLHADRDPDPLKRLEPVPGANDGASGVAVLLELARSLPAEAPPVWLVFLDAEDNGHIEGWDWILGSRALVPELGARPEAVVIVDMVGDEQLTLYQEAYSDPVLTAAIWQEAARLGHDDVFLPRVKHRILDDHLPFLEAGIPAVDIIDIEYPYWHTTLDTPDKVSAESLAAVGETLLSWIMSYERLP